MTLAKRWRWLVERVTGFLYRFRVKRGRATMGRQVRYRITTSLILDRADGTRWRWDDALQQWITD